MLPAALTGYLWLKGGHPALPGWPCPLRALTGIPCPTCFLTRATELALRGDLGGSLAQHAFGPLAAATLVAWSVLAIRQRRLVPRLLVRLPPAQLPAWPLAAAAAVGLVGYWGARLTLQLALGWATFPEL
ncbi:MAG: DUF2752 domain-containing protein [Prochlorococcaceae cyanobacterium]